MKTKNLIKIGSAAIILAVMLFVAEFYYTTHYYGHKAVFGIHKNMAWILKKEYRTKIKEIGGTAVGQTDNMYVLNLNDEYGTSLQIWEIESEIPFDKISIDTNYSIYKINLTRYETVFGDTKAVSYYVNYKRNFNKSFKLGISDMASIEYTYTGLNYIGIFGKDLFEYYIESDSKTDIMLQNNWENPEFVIVIYKKGDKIYLIQICALKKFDEKIINILDLK